MFSSSRGILYSEPPTDEERRKNRKPAAKRDASTAEPDATGSRDGAIEPDVDVEDTSPTASRADWTGNLPADD